MAGNFRARRRIVKRLYLIRHAKSSWSNPDLDDFARPLNKRGKEDCPEMAARLARAGIRPDLIVASPARRAKKTAIYMAKGTGYNKNNICYYDELYLGSLSYHLQLIDELLSNVDVLFLVGHNQTITELGEHLTGRHLGNVPTCGIVAVEYPGQDGFTAEAGAGRLLFFDFPKNKTDHGVHK
jgi:phosphohistidine phosphatase